MKEQHNSVQKFIKQFETFEQHLNGRKSSAVHRLRRKALSDFREIGFPGSKNEQWRFTDLSALLNTLFESHHLNPPAGLRKADINSFTFNNNEIQLVFVDGFFIPELSDREQLPDNVVVDSLKTVYSHQAEPFVSEMENDRLFQDDSFRALNAAFLWDGAFIEIGSGVELNRPIHLLFFASKEADGKMDHPHNRIYLRKGASAKIVESFISLNTGTHFTNALSRVELAENARLEHYHLQNENLQSFHIGNTLVKQDRSSFYASTSLTFGGKLTRNNIVTSLIGEGAETVLNGLYMGQADQHIDNNTVIRHETSAGTSHELYQGILMNRSRGVFSGLILVQPHAQKTDARQSNNALLLSDEARIDSKPQLEIYADDVKCTHGATVGRLDKEAIFYLRARGIDVQEAKNMLTFAFAEKVTEKISIQPLRRIVESLILKRFKTIEHFNIEM